MGNQWLISPDHKSFISGAGGGMLGDGRLTSNNLFLSHRK